MVLKRSFYDRIAKYYDISLGLKRDYVKESEFITHMFSLYGASIRNVLDVGCGTGSHAIELAKRGYKVVGIDSSKEMIKIAKEKLNNRRVNVEFKVMDMRKIKFKNRFDAAICMFSTLLHVNSLKEVRQVVKGIANATKFNSIIIIDVPNFYYKRKYYSIRKVNIDSEIHEEDFELIVVAKTTFEKRFYNKEYWFIVREKDKFDSIRGGFKELLVDKEDLEKIFEENKLEVLNAYGNFNFERYDEEKERMIFVLKNKNVGQI